MSRLRTGHYRTRLLWLPLLTLVSAIGTGCNGSDHSDENELPFVPYEAPTDIISPLPGAPTEEQWWDPSFYATGCDARWPTRAEIAWRPDAIGTSSVTSRPDDDESERTIGFITMRWSDEGQFERAARGMSRSMELPCFSTLYETRTFAEPVELDGLPDGYRAVRWPESSNQITVVLFDADSLNAMVVNWEERHGSEYDVPIDQLVHAANQAWIEFLADNPPLD